MYNKKTVGQQIKKARLEMNLSQKDLSEKVGISRIMISRYEIAHTEVPLEKLQKIAEALNKPISYFFGEQPKENSQKVWSEAQKYLELFKEKVDGNIVLSPKELLAFSLDEGANKEEAIKEAKMMMKNWYIANNVQKSTNKTFEEWWENAITKS